MTLLSQSPTDMLQRRAASSAVSRACGRTSLMFHGTPEFMLAPTFDGRGEPSGPFVEPALVNGRYPKSRSCRRNGLFPFRVNNWLTWANSPSGLETCWLPARGRGAQPGIIARCKKDWLKPRRRPRLDRGKRDSATIGRFARRRREPNGKNGGKHP